MKTHISLNVSDIQKSIDFYSKMLGVGPAKVKQDYAKFDVADPPLNLSMIQNEAKKGGSLSHLGIQVGSTDDVLEISKRWQSSGLLTLDEMGTDCCYALQDKVWVTDPDGNGWEVFTVLGDTEGAKEGESACCSPADGMVSIGSATSKACK